MWDRKPFGLFAFYYLIAAVSHSVLAYQFVACLLAGAAALLIARIVERQAGLAGGVFRRAVLPARQRPVRGRHRADPGHLQPADRRRGAADRARTAAVVARDRPARGAGGHGAVRAGADGQADGAVRIGLFRLTVLVCLHHAGLPGPHRRKVAAVFMLIGALPTLAIAGFYWLNGHWFEFWHAMVMSRNLKKAAEGGEAWRALGNVLRAAVLLAFAAGGLLLGTAEQRFRVFASPGGSSRR